MENKTEISAQVILKPAGGEDVIAGENITSANVHLLFPAQESFEKAQKFFADLKFKVEDAFANSFAIAADKTVFEKTFDTRIFQDVKQNFKAARNDVESGELPLDKLPGEIREIIKTVTFSELPDFGPENF